MTPIALIQGKFYVLVVESAPWCLEPGTTIKIKDRIIAYVSEIVNRWCVNNAGLTIFTQSEYQQSLLTKRQARGHVIHASSRTGRIHNHKTGVIVNSNDPVALAGSIEWSGQNLPQLQSMGKASLLQAHSMTHQEMHRQRWQL
ncbi:hypothetical protein [Microcoleus sp. F4-D5]|uniref:hypothetical protein n=1 Tax=Microcoleus sp. F4-D5 TaxID=2818760 RepID=UPI002FD3E081